MCQANIEWLRTEYEVINQWRMSKVQSNDILTYIFVPLATGTFLSSFLITAFEWLPILFWFFSFFLILFWRVLAHRIDDGIVSTYPRIVELEERLSFRFTRDWLKSRWWPDRDNSWLPKIQDVKSKIEEIPWCHLRKYFRSPYGNRGQEALNKFAVVLILVELLVSVSITIWRYSCTSL